MARRGLPGRGRPRRRRPRPRFRFQQRLQLPFLLLAHRRLFRLHVARRSPTRRRQGRSTGTDPPRARSRPAEADVESLRRKRREPRHAETARLPRNRRPRETRHARWPMARRGGRRIAALKKEGPPPGSPSFPQIVSRPPG